MTKFRMSKHEEMANNEWWWAIVIVITRTHEPFYFPVLSRVSRSLSLSLVQTELITLFSDPIRPFISPFDIRHLSFEE
jgi:hypothetical protein